MKSVCSTENDSKVGNMIAAQCRAGRGLINMTVKELAARARVATDTIVRFENGAELKPRTVDAIAGALSAAGVEFLPDGGVRPRA
jgi:transcriptional regulator with XRE-family HTH domain